MGRISFVTVIAIIFFSILAFAVSNKLKNGDHFKSRFVQQHLSSVSPVPLSLITAERLIAAKQFVHKNNYNNSFCFLIDLSLPSGRNRFFIYDFKKDTIVQSGLVTHGNCNQYWLEGRQYGNTVGCGCSSLGRYKVGKYYYGKFGLAYKLHGLDSTNNKAFERFVVLHSHACVPDTETKEDICQSNGCPTVSPSFLQVLQAKINASPKPVLLWMYD